MSVSPGILRGIGGGAESAPYNLYAFQADGMAAGGFPITLAGPLMPSPFITDIDDDSDVDIVFAGWDFLVHVWDMPFAYDPSAVPWPTYKGNARRDGVVSHLAASAVDDLEEIPAAGFTVGAAYSNPFNPSTSVRLYIPRSSHLEWAVYDVQGRKIRTLHTGVNFRLR